MVSGVVLSIDDERKDREVLSLTNRSRTPKISIKDGAGILKRLCTAELTILSKIDRNANNTIGMDCCSDAAILL